MKEARIILPTSIADSDRIHRALATTLAHVFGGYTRTDGTGGWVNDDGELIEDTVAIYDVAVAQDHLIELSTLQLRSIARTFAFVAQQDCVYVRYPDGDVELAKPFLLGEIICTP